MQQLTEEGNPDSHADGVIRVPEANGEGSSDQFEREGDSPLQDVVPAHSKRP